ncbi:helicase-associated domain-containing protein [Spirillospora sp. NPDC047279]|uniref:helicase-associated domain-containing protein n=1 Tax=Spirillospora sp. NPDC047279 TaxID=3155478 RepID=UPI0033EE59FB
MDALDPVVAWLGERTPEELARLIEARPYTLGYGPEPRTLHSLAGKLLAPHNLASIDDLSLPELEVVLAAASMANVDGDVLVVDVPEKELLSGLGAESGERRAAALAVVESLRSRLLLLPARQGYVGVPAALAQQAGRSVPAARTVHRALTASYNKPEILFIAGGLGLPSAARPEAARSGVQREVVAFLTDQGRVRALVASAPADARELLDRLVEARAKLRTFCFVARAGRYGFREDGSGDPATDWLAARGLLVPAGDELAEVPLEVSRALGSDYPFNPMPPMPVTKPASPERVREEAQAAVSAAANTLERLLKALDMRPATMRKSGGVAVRETRRLASAAGVDEIIARFWIELAAAAELIAVRATKQEARLLPTKRYDDWLQLPPAQRMAPIVRAWMRFSETLTWSPFEQTPVPLHYERYEHGAATLRAALLKLLADLPDGTGLVLDEGTLPEPTLAALHWQCPGLLSTDPAEPDYRPEHNLTEAELLGLSAHGALTGPGLALIGSGDLVTTLDALLPAPQEKAHFPGDLTAVVPGVPTTELADLLTATADRESDGHAVVWRFTPASVRRALDAGRDAAEIIAALTDAALAPLPQALEYLVTDTARRHGQIKVVRSACCLRSDDETLLQEIAGHRSLRKLALRRIAPTVLISTKPVAATLEALRAAGYAPALEAETGAMVFERASRERAPLHQGHGRPRRNGEPEAALALARRLLA